MQDLDNYNQGSREVKRAGRGSQCYRGWKKFTFSTFKNTGLTNVWGQRNFKVLQWWETKIEMQPFKKRILYFTRPIFLASVSYINNLHILTIKTSASSSSTCKKKKGGGGGGLYLNKLYLHISLCFILLFIQFKKLWIWYVFFCLP